MPIDTSFDRFAEQYDKEMGNTGDFAHQNTIDKALLELVGEVEDLTIYDLACGNGYMARKFVKAGAKAVWASDFSEKLLNLAKTKYEATGIKYLLRAADNFTDIPENYFDLLTMNMAIFYVEDLDKLTSGIRRSLKPGGRFIFTIDHPLKNLFYKKINIDIDPIAEAEKYLNIGLEKNYNNWTKKQQDLDIYQRPMGYYINACGKNGLLVKSVNEPKTVASHSGKPVETGIPFKMAIETVKI